MRAVAALRFASLVFWLASMGVVDYHFKGNSTSDNIQFFILVAMVTVAVIGVSDNWLTRLLDRMEGRDDISIEERMKAERRVERKLEEEEKEEERKKEEEKVKSARQFVEENPLRFDLTICDEVPRLHLTPTGWEGNNFIYMNCVNSEQEETLQVVVLDWSPKERFNLGLRDQHLQEYHPRIPAGKIERVLLGIHDRYAEGYKKFNPSFGIVVTFGFVPCQKSVPEGAMWERKVYLTPDELQRGWENV